MPETTFACPDLTTFLGLDALGLTAVGLHLTAERAVIECRMPIGFEDPFCKACGAQGQARGTAPGPRTGGMETHAAGGVPAALRLHPLPPGVETGHLGAGSATGAADPRGGGVGAAGPCPGVHVGLPAGSRPGDLLAHRQQRNPDSGRADHRRQP